MKNKNNLFIAWVFAVFSTFAVLTGCSVFDKESPVIAIESPENLAEVASPFLVTGTASDNVEVTSVQYRVDTGTYADVEGREEWTVILDITTLGRHYITIKAADGNRNTAYAYLELEVIEPPEEP
ncbi:MAG: hypothetical protein JW874_09055 [Spirochaetales bacterium]|nr:hypothetical protein [Spirochaetales bacterium]